MAGLNIKLKIGTIMGLLVLVPLITLIIIYTKRGKEWFVGKFLMMFIPNSMMGSSTIYLQLERATALRDYEVISNSNPSRKYRILRVLIITWIYESLIISILNSFVPIAASNPTRYIFWTLQILSLIHTVKLFRCQLAPPLYRLFIAFPYTLVFTSCIFIFPFLIPIALFGLESPYIYYYLSAPFVASAISIYFTIRSRSAKRYEQVHIELHNDIPFIDSVKRCVQSKPPPNRPPLRVIQITDAHIGSMMSVARLKYICRQIVSLKPDLVLLTGDFFTIEAYGGGYDVPAKSTSLIEGLSPLLSLPGRCFACLGNHDKEDIARKFLSDGLATLNIPLLVDAEQIIETQNGRVQLIGLDYRVSDRQLHISSTLDRFPRPDNVDYRLIMLHDPGAFKHINPKDGSLVFSGHTHGGQVGWMYGFHLSLMDVIGIPDNGLWGFGNNRLYVHRGQGTRSLFSNCISRIGIPNEDSVINIYNK